MNPKQEFLIIETSNDIAVYSPSTFPLGTPIARDARRLAVDGPLMVHPPKIHLNRAEFDQWRRQLEAEGNKLTIGPFWRHPELWEESMEAIRRGETISLEDFRNELLGKDGGVLTRPS
jgi:hypothetical protein